MFHNSFLSPVSYNLSFPFPSSSMIPRNPVPDLFWLNFFTISCGLSVSLVCYFLIFFKSFVDCCCWLYICFFLHLLLSASILSRLSCSGNSSLAVFNIPHEFFSQEIDGILKVYNTFIQRKFHFFALMYQRISLVFFLS